MTRFEALRKEAKTACEQIRGHKMAKFQHERVGNAHHATSVCKVCSMSVSVTPRFSYEIIGEAVAMNCERVKCKYPMSDYFTYEDEIPPNTRVSTPEDCENCDGFENDDCKDAKHCLKTETL